MFAPLVERLARDKEREDNTVKKFMSSVPSTRVARRKLELIMRYSQAETKLEVARRVHRPAPENRLPVIHSVLSCNPVIRPRERGSLGDCRFREKSNVRSFSRKILHDGAEFYWMFINNLCSLN